MAMNTEARWLTFPIGAGMAEGPERWAEISGMVDDIPRPILAMVASPQSASFIRGLAKAYKLPPQRSQVIAYAVLRVAFGEKAITELSAMLAAELGLPPEKARQIATEIEQGLFEPVKDQLGKALPEDRREIPPVNLPEEDDAEAAAVYAEVAKTPTLVQQMIASPKTTAVLKRLTKRYGARADRVEAVRLLVARLAIGRVPRAKLGRALAVEIPLPLNKAEQMAQEIEKELFEPINTDLSAHLAEGGRPVSLNKNGSKQEKPANQDNVLNLKKERRPPAPPMPKKGASG